MRTTPLVALGLAVVMLAGADAASAFLSANTIDELATHKKHGRLVRVTGPIGCTRGERVSISVGVRQPATAARARNRWKGRCTGEVQHWQVRARTRRGTRFENGSGRVCAVANTRTGSRVTDTRRWCERVNVSASQSRGHDSKTTAEDVCFTVNNIGDPIPSTVRGTLFRSKKRFRSRSTALLLQHGAVSERSAWSGGAPVIEGTHDTARSLAKRGYAVFAIDRLGYGDSPYGRPAGIRLAADPGRLHRDDPPDGHPDPRRLVHQLRRQAGGPRRHPCRPVRLQLGSRHRRGLRHSPPRHRRNHPDVLVEPAATLGGLPGARSASWCRSSPRARTTSSSSSTAPTATPSSARIPVLRPGDEGQRSRAALRARLLRPDRLADAERRGRQPNLRGRDNRERGPTPVLLVFGDRDAAFPGAHHHGADPDVVTPEIAMWRNGCNCEVSVYLQRNAGHVGLFHRTSKKRDQEDPRLARPPRPLTHTCGTPTRASTGSARVTGQGSCLREPGRRAEHELSLLLCGQAGV